MANKIKNVFKTTQITAIFFDLDNTIIETRIGDHKAINKVSQNIKTIKIVLF